jgi:pyridoxal phosphate enzyme (YggS family)
LGIAVTESDESRRTDLAASLAEVRERIAAAARAVGRDPAGIRLLAVTKTRPARDAALLTDLGVLDLAENREQEGAAKAAELTALRPNAQVRWHLVGRLQRNKARSVARWAAEVQSVDSPRLAQALARAVAAARSAGERSDPLDVLVQASIDGDPDRGGCPVGDLPDLAEEITRSGDLRLRGLMAVAPLDMDPEGAFEVLATAAERLRRDHPAATELSAGMSADLERAVAHGSTCVRVGTALLGERGLASP